MTAAAIARYLAEEGYAAGGIVEHLDTQPKHPLYCLEALVAEFRTLASPLDLYVGAELDYQGEGISIPEAPAIRERLGLDYYLCAAHGVGEGVRSAAEYIEDQRRRLMAIVEEVPCADVVAHPWAEGHAHARRGRIEGWRFAWIPERYLREFVEAAAAYGKAVELNGKALADAGDPAFARYLELLRDSGAPVTTGSDAHSMERAGRIGALVALLQGAGFTPDRMWTPRRR
jgi:histidinol phosphatase-like PHP family hydrolase